MWLLMRLDFRLALYLFVCCWMGLMADADTAANDADNDAEFNCCGKFDGWNVAVVDDKFFTSANDSSVGVSPAKKKREEKKKQINILLLRQLIRLSGWRTWRVSRQGQEETFCLRTNPQRQRFSLSILMTANALYLHVRSLGSLYHASLQLQWNRCVGKRVTGRTHRRREFRSIGGCIEAQHKDRVEPEQMRAVTINRFSISATTFSIIT